MTTITLAPELLDVRQTALLLNIGRNQVYRMAQMQQLPCLRFGNRFRFPRSSLLAWIEQQVRSSE